MTQVLNLFSDLAIKTFTGVVEQVIQVFIRELGYSPEPDKAEEIYSDLEKRGYRIQRDTLTSNPFMEFVTLYHNNRPLRIKKVWLGDDLKIYTQEFDPSRVSH